MQLIEASGGLTVDLMLSEAPQQPTTTPAHVQPPFAKLARPHAMDTSATVAIVLKHVTHAITQAHTRVPPCFLPAPPAPLAILFPIAILISVVLAEHGDAFLNA